MGRAAVLVLVSGVGLLTSRLAVNVALYPERRSASFTLRW